VGRRVAEWARDQPHLAPQLKPAERMLAVPKHVSARRGLSRQRSAGGAPRSWRPWPHARARSGARPLAAPWPGRARLGPATVGHRRPPRLCPRDRPRRAPGVRQRAPPSSRGCTRSAAWTRPPPRATRRDVTTGAAAVRCGRGLACWPPQRTSVNAAPSDGLPSLGSQRCWPRRLLRGGPGRAPGGGVRPRGPPAPSPSFATSSAALGSAGWWPSARDPGSAAAPGDGCQAAERPRAAPPACRPWRRDDRHARRLPVGRPGGHHDASPPPGRSGPPIRGEPGQHPHVSAARPGPLRLQRRRPGLLPVVLHRVQHRAPADGPRTPHAGGGAHAAGIRARARPPTGLAGGLHGTSGTLGPAATSTSGPPCGRVEQPARPSRGT